MSACIDDAAGVRAALAAWQGKRGADFLAPAILARYGDGLDAAMGRAMTGNGAAGEN